MLYPKEPVRRCTWELTNWIVLLLLVGITLSIVILAIKLGPHFEYERARHGVFVGPLAHRRSRWAQIPSFRSDSLEVDTRGDVIDLSYTRDPDGKWVAVMRIGRRRGAVEAAVW
jgi:hypothetical protein